MSDISYTHGRSNFKALSDVTKRLISGPRLDDIEPWLDNEYAHNWNGAFLKEIGKQLRVTIGAKRSARHLHFQIKGPQLNIQIAESLLERLDQHAGVIATDNNLHNVKSIRAKDYQLLDVHFRSLLEQARTALTGELDKIKAAKIIEARQRAETLSGSFAEAGNKAAEESKKSKNKKKDKSTNFQNFEPSNISQAIGYTAIMDDDIDVMVLGGVAGGGKTYMAVAAGLFLIETGKVEAIELYRPDQGAGNKMGALPGGKQDKEDIFLETVSDTLLELSGKDLRSHLKSGTVKEAATPFAKRGATFRGTFVIVDEGQNLTIDQAKLLQTRIGKGVKMVITGDISSEQNDLRGRCPGLAHLIAVIGRKFNMGSADLRNHMAFVEFTGADSLARHRLLPAIHEAYADMPEEWIKAIKDMEMVPQRAIEATKLFMEAAADNMKQASITTYNRFVAAANQRFPAIFGGQQDPKVVQFPPLTASGRNP